METSEEFLNNLALENGYSDYGSFFNNEFDSSIFKKAMVEFAKMHVEAALESASKVKPTIVPNSKYVGKFQFWDPKLIKGAYSIEDVK